MAENFGEVRSSWSDDQRLAVWCLICKSRRELEIGISPIVSNSFIILQRYFRESESCDYDLFILMVAALYSACKAANSYRPMQAIYKVLSDICQSAPSLKIKQIVGDRIDNPIIDTQELEQIASAERDLMKIISFNYDFETPFTHFQKWKQTLMSTIPDQSLIRMCNGVIVDMCLLLCSSFYLDLPPEVAAAAAVEDSFNSSNEVISVETIQWMNKIKEKYGIEIFNMALQSISEEKRKTARMP